MRETSSEMELVGFSKLSKSLYPIDNIMLHVLNPQGVKKKEGSCINLRFSIQNNWDQPWDYWFYF